MLMDMLMEHDAALDASAALERAFQEPGFLRRLRMNQADARRLLEQVNWNAALRPLLPIRQRLTCGQVLELCRPMLSAAAP